MAKKFRHKGKIYDDGIPMLAGCRKYRDEFGGDYFDLARELAWKGKVDCVGKNWHAIGQDGLQIGEDYSTLASLFTEMTEELGLEVLEEH